MGPARPGLNPSVRKNATVPSRHFEIGLRPTKYVHSPQPEFGIALRPKEETKNGDPKSDGNAKPPPTVNRLDNFGEIGLWRSPRSRRVRLRRGRESCGGPPPAVHARVAQIGRASCRERVGG